MFTSIFNILRFFSCLITLFIIDCGHEVLYKHELTKIDLKPHELLIVQFDNRPLGNYWNQTAVWNQLYAHKYHHNYLYLTLESVEDSSCYYDTITLAPAWCKVRAMVEADKIADDEIKAILYLDSDVIITVNYSMTHVLSYIKSSLHWNYAEKPVAFNQDGPGWACRITLKLSFKYCLNSGTVFWIRSPISTQIIQEWWNSVGEPYDSNRFPMKWRQKWPWEQAQMYTIYERYRNHILRLSFPDEAYLPWTSNKNPRSQYPTDAVEPWCFSHWPGANCFITHYCASVNQKAKLMLLDYSLLDSPGTNSIATHHNSSIVIRTVRIPL